MIAVTLNFMGRTVLRHSGKKARKGYLSLCKRFRKCLVCSGQRNRMSVSTPLVPVVEN